MRKILESCPTCGGPLVITTVRCERCATEVRSEYAPCQFCHLSAEQISFVLLFLRNRGNQSEMEKALGVSYPTVRGKLDEVLRVISPAATVAPIAPVAEPEAPRPPVAPAAPTRPSAVDRRRAILDAIAQGRLDAAGGLAALRESTAPPSDSPTEAPQPESQSEPTLDRRAESQPESTEEPR